MSFIPPLFTKFGKTCHDLLNQRFEVKKGDLNHEVTVKSRANNTTITTHIQAEDHELSKLNAKVKAVHLNKGFGDVTIEYTTSGKIKSNTKQNHQYPGLIVNIENAMMLTALSLPAQKMGGDYAQENFTAQLEFNKEKNALLATSVVGVDGLSAGIGATFNMGEGDKGGSSSSPSLDFGVQYEDHNLIATVGFENSDIGISLYHRASSIAKIGSKLTLTEKGNSLAFGTEYLVDKNTYLKGKVQVFDSKDYVLCGHISHRLPDNRMTVGVTSMYESKKGTKPVFGVNFAFGEH